MKLSILVPTIKRHDKYFTLLKFELYAQMLPHSDEVELLYDDSEVDSIGEKRNRLMGRAKGKYLCFIDADDWPIVNYVELLIKAIESDCDCMSLMGSYSVDGVFDGIFEHSLKYDKWETVDGEIKYLRFPNHLNCIKSEIAKQFKFPEKNFGEDFDWSTIVHEAGVLKTEHYIPEILYFYRYATNKN